MELQRDELQESLRDVVVEVMRTAEPAQMLNALFGLDLPESAVVSAPTAAALARSVELAWFESGATAEELAERLAALVDED